LLLLSTIHFSRSSISSRVKAPLGGAFGGGTIIILSQKMRQLKMQNMTMRSTSRSRWRFWVPDDARHVTDSALRVDGCIVERR
jgi:hypothetical protein